MIEMVTHCYNPPGTDQYAQLLKWQLASLANNPPKTRYQITVCHWDRDEAMFDMIAGLKELCLGVSLSFLPMEQGKLFRRAIGRNIRAKRTKAKVIWFTDCDYLFGEGCLDTVVDLVSQNMGLCIPATVKINVDHATGNAAIERERDNPLPQIIESEFKERREKKAIGGLQIIGGRTANQIGYLDGTSWVDPVDASKGFRSCRCDKVWRTKNKLASTRLPILNCYRMRHELDGRDYDAIGTKGEGKVNW